MSVAEYLRHVNGRLEQEEDRLVSYLDPNTTRLPLISTLVNELIARQLDRLLSSDLVATLKARATDQLKLYYSLSGKVHDGVDKLRAHFRMYVINTGREIVNNPSQDAEKDRLMIQSLLDFRDEMHNLVKHCFGNNASFLRVLQDAHEEFINQRANKPAELLAKYLDSILRSGNKAQTDDELDKLMDKVCVCCLYCFVCLTL